MHTRTLTTLEFDRIVEAVGSYALTPLGAEALAQMRPLTDPRAVRAGLDRTAEAVRFVAANGALRLEAPDNLQQALTALAIEAQPLEPSQLLSLTCFLGSVERVCQSVAAASDGPYPGLSAIVDGCAAWSRECAEVRKKIDEAGEVTDDASPELKAIRERRRKQRNRLRGNLEAYLRGRDTARYLQEQVVSERNGRFVLIVRSEHRNAIPGIVHGSSSSGASLFLEPLSTVDINNEIVSLEEQDRLETRRVLLALSTVFRRRAADLRRTLTAGTDLDVLQARAAFAAVVDGVQPDIAADRTFVLRNARHPLLMRAVASRLGAPVREDMPEEPVPVDILMTPPTSALIVTGPNTGGKTVALKTAGLLALMAQSGLHIPAAAGSSVPVFRSVFADIGDQQSISTNLSTFSGHVANIVEMDHRLSPPALILLDEVGAGTDPLEGGALGRAVVEHFRDRGAHVIASTHDEALKAYGATTEGVGCAAFGFDPDTFAPTYRLIYGSAGRSLALEIARRLGLAPDIIETATALRSGREALLADHLAQIEEDRREREELRRSLDRQQADLSARAMRLDERDAELTQRERTERGTLNQSLKVRLRTAREEIDGVVSALRNRAAAIDRQVAARTDQQGPRLTTGDSGELRRAAHSALDAVAQRLRPTVSEPDAPDPGPRQRVDVTLGAQVAVSSLGVEGAVLSLQGTEAEVEVHGKRIRVPFDALEVIGPSRPPAEPRSRVAIQVDTPTGQLDELNLIGCRVDEALARAEKHLDQALMGESRIVRFIHGHGTGQLRRAIAEFLNGHVLVARISPAPPEEGGTGVTVAELKE